MKDKTNAFYNGIKFRTTTYFYTLASNHETISLSVDCMRPRDLCIL